MRALLAVLLLVSCFLSTACQSTMGKVMRKYGYTEFVPPTTFVKPGAVVRLKQSSPAIVGMVCPNESSLGSEVESRYLDSSTSSMGLTSELKKTFELEASYLDTINGKVGYEALEKVSLTLRNVRVIALSEDLVVANRGKRNPDCGEAIARRLDNKDSLTMIESVVIADASYSVEFSSTVTAEAKGPILEEIAATLNTRISDSGKELVEGKGLIWGIRDDPFLFDISRKGREPASVGGIKEDLSRVLMRVKGPASLIVESE